MSRDVRDPETDPTATWAIEPEAVAPLLAGAAVGPGAERVTLRTPLTDAPLADVPQGTAADAVAAVERARRAQRVWERYPAGDRAAVLLRFHDLLLERRGEILDLLQLENGKDRASAFEEVADVALLARHYGVRGPAYLATTRYPGIVPGLTGVRVERRPRGVVGVIGPFNYPFTLTIGDALPALVAGNAVVVKPDSRTPLAALWAAALLAEAGLPDDVLQVVPGPGSAVGTALVDAVDHVNFTGSTATGRRIAQQAAGRLVGVSLELGGKNALYVADDADPALAAEGAVRACFANTGQLCASIERIYLHEAVAEAFLAEFLPRVGALRLGTGLDYSYEVGALTGPSQLATFTEHLTDALARGATVLAGGRVRDDVGPFHVEPTVLTDLPDDALAARHETFGPLVAVRVVRTDEEAVRLIDDTPYGLNLSLWTRDVTRARRIAARVSVGMVNINEGFAAVWGSSAAPSGGVKDSGTGRRHGRAGVEAVTWGQTVAVQRGAHAGLGLGRLYGLPAEEWTDLFVRAMRGMRALRRP